jgi:hypothetical protein
LTRFGRDDPGAPAAGAVSNDNAERLMDEAFQRNRDKPEGAPASAASDAR